MGTYDCRMFLFRRLPSLQLQTELQRLEVLKMNSIKSFIETIRTEIAVYWEKCFYSLEQREAFAPYHAGESSGMSVCDRGRLWERGRQRMLSRYRQFH